MLPGVLPVVDAHQREMRRLEASAILAARRTWARLNPATVLDQWERTSRTLLPVITNLQVAAATAGAQYGADTLAAQHIRTEPDAQVQPEAFAGWASDGRPLATLLTTPTLAFRAAMQRQLPPVEAFRHGGRALEQIAHTQIGDAARVAAGIDVATRPRVRWVRMVNPPTCARCLVLAGRIYRWSDGFDRHPRDDCVHVATNVAAARREGLVDDPQTYFQAVSRAEQDRMLGKAGAQAVRDGADLNQVVNAHRGMTVAAPFGQPVLATTEGMTRRGLAGQQFLARGATTKARRVQAVRLMPEQIYREATSRTDALRLLALHGYIR
jgi:hypothetical protein